ncbi:MAG: hypothetical protein ACRC62_15495 [Microcoleus sp.]
MLYIGIDPGVSGAIAIVSTNGTILIHDCPLLPKEGRWNRHDSRGLMAILSSINPDEAVAVLEHVRFDGRDDGHKTTTEILVRSHEAWLTCLNLRGIPVLDLEPLAWRKAVAASKLGTNEVAIVEYACKLYPQCVDELKRPSLKEKCKFVYEHNRAEALLMAHAARSLDNAGRFDFLLECAIA